MRTLCTVLMNIDKLDVDILQILRHDARATIKDIATQLGRRRATIHARINKMMENEVIKGYTAIPDFKQLDLPITVFILVSILQKDYDSPDDLYRLTEDILNIPRITEIYSCSGEYDYLLKARINNLKEVQDIIYKLRVYNVGKTYTMTVFETRKEELSNDIFYVENQNLLDNSEDFEDN